MNFCVQCGEIIRIPVERGCPVCSNRCAVALAWKDQADRPNLIAEAQAIAAALPTAPEPRIQFTTFDGYDSCGGVSLPLPHGPSLDPSVLEVAALYGHDRAWAFEIGTDTLSRHQRGQLRAVLVVREP